MKKIILLLIIFILFPGCTKKDAPITPQPVKLKRFTKNTLAISRSYSIPLSLIVYAEKEPDWEGALKKVTEDSLVYDYRNSENGLAKLNSTGMAILEPPAYDLLKKAVEIGEKSKGAFDPVILPLTTLWSLDEDFNLPGDDVVNAAAALVNYQFLTWGDGFEVNLPVRSGVDLGGIAKGAIVDNLGEWFKSRGMTDFLIEAGGDILMCGNKADGKPWTIAIRHPRKDKSMVTVPFKGGEPLSLVTSGDYERFKMIDGKRYHHLVDPRTGWPTEDNCSVSVTAPNCTEADGYATAAFIMGFEKGLEFLENIPGVEGLFIRETEGVLEGAITSGFPADLDKLDL